MLVSSRLPARQGITTNIGGAGTLLAMPSDGQPVQHPAKPTPTPTPTPLPHPATPAPTPSKRRSEHEGSNSREAHKTVFLAPKRGEPPQYDIKKGAWRCTKRGVSTTGQEANRGSGAFWVLPGAVCTRSCTRTWYRIASPRRPRRAPWRRWGPAPAGCPATGPAARGALWAGAAAQPAAARLRRRAGPKPRVLGFRGTAARHWAAPRPRLVAATPRGARGAGARFARAGGGGAGARSLLGGRGRRVHVADEDGDVIELAWGWVEGVGRVEERW
jgi:hypothetical protein